MALLLHFVNQCGSLGKRVFCSHWREAELLTVLFNRVESLQQTRRTVMNIMV